MPSIKVKALELSNAIRRLLLLYEVCMVAVYTVCVLMLLLCPPDTYKFTNNKECRLMSYGNYRAVR